jgi:hypothetical protein
VKRRRLLEPILAALLFTLMPGSALAQKTESVTVRNGDRMVGEIKGLQRGQLEFKTDAMSTVYVKWPRVATVKTDKVFEIQLDDGRVFFGSLTPGSQDSVVIKTDSQSVGVATQRVVSLQRLKPSFWEALDGSVNLGFDFTQQNAKTDLNLSGDVHYAHRGTADSTHHTLNLSKLRRGFALTKLSFNSTFSRQDSTEDIKRLTVGVSHLKQLKSRWFWLLSLVGEQNSQLSLDYRGTAAAGVGHFLVQTNKLDLALLVAPGYSRERFTSESPDSSIPLIIAADVEYFTWGMLDTNVSSRLSVLPILSDWGRWRIDFSLTAKREVLKNVYINFGVTEAFDSDPTAADANKNDFSFNTSFGWSF